MWAEYGKMAVSFQSNQRKAHCLKLARSGSTRLGLSGFQSAKHPSSPPLHNVHFLKAVLGSLTAVAARPI